jgi:hypothetical protein
MIQRVMSELMGLKNVVVLNDEALHCYRERTENDDVEDLKGAGKDEAKRNIPISMPILATVLSLALLSLVRATRAWLRPQSAGRSTAGPSL